MIRALVVDDSSFMRKSLARVLQSDGAIEVVATAADGEDAVSKVKQLHPDVVLLDIEMPVMDGLAALSHIMAECPTPVLMLSALDKRNAAIAITSLEHGAVDFIPKPSGVISYDIEESGNEIVAKVKLAARVNVRKLALRLPQESYQRPYAKSTTSKDVVVIGASTGGPRALMNILSSLPGDISAAVLVVQHMAPDFVPSLVSRLESGCPLKVSVARKGQPVSPGEVLVAPGGYHTTIVPNGHSRRIRLSRKGAPCGVVPSVDYAMESAAAAYGRATLGVLLTGLGADGVRGLETIKRAGGYTIAEDPSTCVASGMPKAAIEAGCVDEILPLPRIGQAIVSLAKRAEKG